MRGNHGLVWFGCKLWLCIFSIVTSSSHDAFAQSVDRLNYRISYDTIGFAYVEHSCFVYDLLILLPNVSTTFIPEVLPTCLYFKSFSVNQSLYGWMQLQPVAAILNYFKRVRCSSGLKTLITVLRDYHREIHSDITRLIYSACTFSLTWRYAFN